MTQNDRWISVKKRIPELDIQVLGFCGNARFGSYVLCQISKNNDDELSWHIFGSCDEHDAGYGSVNFWQPLPEAPHD